MAGMREGDQSCNGNAVTEGDLAGNDSGWYLWVMGVGIRRCARSAIDGWGRRVFQHGRHIALKRDLGHWSWQPDDDESASPRSPSSQR